MSISAIKMNIIIMKKICVRIAIINVLVVLPLKGAQNVRILYFLDLIQGI